MSLKYLQNTNRIITSKNYVKQGEKRDKQKVLQRSGAGKPDVSEFAGWPVSTGCLLVPIWKAAWQDSWNILAWVLP